MGRLPGPWSDELRQLVITATRPGGPWMTNELAKCSGLSAHSFALFKNGSRGTTEAPARRILEAFRLRPGSPDPTKMLALFATIPTGPTGKRPGAPLVDHTVGEDMRRIRLRLRELLTGRFNGRVPDLARWLQMTTSATKRLLDGGSLGPPGEAEILWARIAPDAPAPETSSALALPPPSAPIARASSPATPAPTHVSSLVDKWAREAISFVLEQYHQQEGKTGT